MTLGVRVRIGFLYRGTMVMVRLLYRWIRVMIRLLYRWKCASESSWHRMVLWTRPQ